jgi:hypothetical protein
MRILNHTIKTLLQLTSPGNVGKFVQLFLENNWNLLVNRLTQEFLVELLQSEEQVGSLSFLPFFSLFNHLISLFFLCSS